MMDCTMLEMYRYYRVLGFAFGGVFFVWFRRIPT
jgi:hypothetical protein